MIEIDTTLTKEEIANRIIQNCINRQLSFTYKNCSDYIEIIVTNVYVYSFQIRFYYGSYVVYIKSVEGELKISDFLALHQILQNI